MFHVVDIWWAQIFYLQITLDSHVYDFKPKLPRCKRYRQSFWWASFFQLAIPYSGWKCGGITKFQDYHNLLEYVRNLAFMFCTGHIVPCIHVYCMYIWIIWRYYVLFKCVQVPDIHRRSVCVQRNGHPESAGHGVWGGTERIKRWCPHDTQVVIHIQEYMYIHCVCICTVGSGLWPYSALTAIL